MRVRVSERQCESNIESECKYIINESKCKKVKKIESLSKSEVNIK